MFATLASILRSELEALLLRKIVTPDARVDERERAFVDASRAVLGAEALGDAQKRHTNKGAAFQPKSRPKPKRKEKPVVVSTDQDHDESATHGDAQSLRVSLAAMHAEQRPLNAVHAMTSWPPPPRQCSPCAPSARQVLRVSRGSRPQGASSQSSRCTSLGGSSTRGRGRPSSPSDHS